MEIKSINSKLKQLEKAREPKISSSTFRRCKRKSNLLSPYRLPSLSNTHTRKPKTSNNTKHYLKMTSKDLKMASNDLKMTSKDGNSKFVPEKVKPKTIQEVVVQMMIILSNERISLNMLFLLNK